MRNLLQYPIDRDETLRVLADARTEIGKHELIGDVRPLVLEMVADYLRVDPRFADYLRKRDAAFEPRDYPALYILMRDDMESMNAGKAVAQGTHAANQCVALIRDEGTKEQQGTLARWEAETPAKFGTAITLAGDIREIRAAVESAKLAGLVAGICHDPTYPLEDGQAFHHIPIDTCGFVFGMKNDIRKHVSLMDLMP